jgi:hypothetical protein
VFGDTSNDARNLSLVDDLREHLKLCEEILALVQRESQSLRDPSQPSQFGVCQERKSILPRLDASLNALRRERSLWQQMTPAQRAEYPQVPVLMRQNQDLIMKILVLDRENEQALLRRGMVPPRHIPPAARQRPHFVADLYRRNGVGSGNAD